MGKLTAKQVAGLREPGRYGDGDGLLLDVKAADRRYWTYRYTMGGWTRSMTFGEADKVSLTEARNRAAQARGAVKSGVDPLAEKDRAKAAAVAAAAAERALRAQAATFRAAALAYIEAHRSGWRARGEQLWHGSLAKHVFPVFGTKPVAEVTVDDVLKTLTPIWAAKSVTATIVRSRIELVLSYAKARGWRSGENVARWRDHLDHLLPKPAKVHNVTHRAALDWRAAPGLLAALADDDTMGARALAFLVLTAARSGEVRGATWREIDLPRKLWSIPRERMKANRAHTVPLSEPAADVLRELAALRQFDAVFFGRYGAAMDDTTLTVALRRAGYVDCSVHGMRACFASWAQDSGHAPDLIEQSLAHVIGNQVARSYRRSDMIERRRTLMSEWAAFLTRPPAEVVPLRAAG